MAAKHRKPRATVILSVYLYRQCARAKQEGVIRLKDPPNHNRELQFDHLDEIPRKIRQHLKAIGLTYEIADQSDDTVIAPKQRKRRVIKKIRKDDANPLPMGL